MRTTAVRVSNLSKQYTIDQARRPHDTLQSQLEASLRGLLRRKAFQRSRKETIWALKGVSFEVASGEVVGLIGRNGAGKSTLLKILSRITYPTEGRVEIFGRVSSLLEVGTGFHAELSGRENVYLNAAILGMPWREIDRKFDEIVGFAEVERFIDTPVKRYSSGMYVRLAFAVAAHLDPDILLVDEVLAVGDAEFQKKCLGKLDEVSRSGKTVIFVSHSMAPVRKLCDRALLIGAGMLVDAGPVEKVIARYLGDFGEEDDGDFFPASHPARLPNMRPIIKRLRLVAADGAPKTVFYPDEPLITELTLDPVTPIKHPKLAIGVEDNLGRRITTLAPHFQGQQVSDIDQMCTVRCTVPRLSLGSGRYLVSAAVWTDGEVLDALENAVSFEVGWRDNFGTGEPYIHEYGPILTRSSWERVD